MPFVADQLVIEFCEKRTVIQGRSPECQVKAHAGKRGGDAPGCKRCGGCRLPLPQPGLVSIPFSHQRRRGVDGYPFRRKRTDISRERFRQPLREILR
jgi:hypothetical protein